METSVSEEAETSVPKEAAGSFYMSYLLDIPPEILLLILRLLQPHDKLRLRLTCRRLYATVSDPAVWSSVLFDYYCTPSRKALDTTLSLCSPGTRKVEIDTRGMISRFPWVHFTKQISKCASSLSHLSLLGFHPTSKQVIPLLHNFSALSHLTLDIQRNGRVWFPMVASMKSFEIRIDSHYSLFTALKAWSQNSCFPHQFQLSSSSSDCWHDLKHLLDAIDRHFPSQLPSDECAQVQLMHHSGPLGLFGHHPFLEVSFKDSRCSVPVAHSSITASPLVLVLSSPQSATRMSIAEHMQLPRVCVDTPFSLVASTLAHLSLKECADVNYESLNEIASHCPLLKYLCLESCNSALDSLSGLASLSEKCLWLEGLNLSKIHGIVDRTLFWNLLSNFRKLSYLAVELCALPVGCELPEQKICTLLSMQVGSVTFDPIIDCITCRSVSDPDGYLKTMGQLMPTNLRVLWIAILWCFVGHGLKDLLCSVPKLQCLSLKLRGKLNPPVDSICYQSIEKFHLECSASYVTCEFVEALVHCRRLTHCYIEGKSISMEAVSKLIQAPRLICCHIRYRARTSRPKSTIYSAAKAQGIPDFSYKQAGFFGSVDTDLRPLWSIS